MDPASIHARAEEIVPEVEAYVDRMAADGWFEDDSRALPMVKAMLLAHFLTPAADVIAGYGRLPIRLVRWVLHRYREEGILTADGTLETTYDDDEVSEVAVQGDRLVLEGRAVREFRDGKWWYYDRPIRKRPDESVYRWHRRAGICGICDEPVLFGRTLCLRHATGEVPLVLKMRWKRAGKCVTCGRPRERQREPICYKCGHARYDPPKKKQPRIPRHYEKAPGRIRKPRIRVVENLRRQVYAARDPRLLTQQSDALVEAAQAGDVVCIARLLAAAEPSCQKAARRYPHLHDDLLGEARLAVLLLLQTFHPGQNDNFVAAAANAADIATRRLTQTLSDPPHTETLDVVHPSTSPEPRDILALRRLNHAYLHRLKPQERRVIEGRFLEDQSLQDLGDEFNLCRERVRVVELDAIRRLRRLIERRPLKSQGKP